jgi:hypothetical protein
MTLKKERTQEIERGSSRTRVGRVFGPVVRQTAELLNLEKKSCLLFSNNFIFTAKEE